MNALQRRLQKNKLGSRGVLRDIVLIAALIFLRFSWTWFFVGLGIFLVGCALHFWSKGCLVRNWVVTMSGPYRLVRHPFYLANFIIDVGICVMSGNVYLLAVYLPLFLIAYIPVIQAEESDLIEAHEEYREFARAVPRLLPYKIHRLFGPLDLSWANIQREQEIPRLLRILASPLYIILVYLAWQLPAATWLKTPAFLAVLVGVVALNLLSVLLRWDPFSDLADMGGVNGRWGRVRKFSSSLLKHPRH